jgi:hypothetical protein
VPAATEAGRIPGGVWVWLAVGFAGLWLLTLIWALRRRTTAGPRRIQPKGDQPVAGSLPTWTLADLRHALDSGSLDEVGDALRGMSAPPCDDLDALSARLDSQQQRDALEQLRRARWAQGDGVVARAALREAFRNGPTWRGVARTTKEILPPLYPPH